ncbi:MAG: putative nucleic-acid-binding protein [Candidatus Omnitrophota bacterium]|jgi:predicted nucleic-acid-binding protein
MKVAIDTNILIRIITRDDDALYQKASRFIKKYGKDDIFVSASTIIETSFVLKSCYQWGKEDVLMAVELIVDTDQFYIDQEPALRQAIIKCHKGFSMYDAFIGEVGAVRNLKTYTLDKKLKSNASFVLL